MKILSFTNSRGQIPLGKVFCVGQNYPEHVREMHSELPKTPVVFMKPSTAVTTGGEPVVLPRISHELHHEVELVLVLGKNGKNIPRSEAMGYIAGYAVGLDMTLRDVQREAKKQGQPWTIAKGFDTSAPLSAVVPADLVPDYRSLVISCRVNGSARQRCPVKEMIFPPDVLIEYISSLFTLEPGDLLFTGTPEGVGPVRPGDKLEAELEGFTSLSTTVISA
jgi:acylpyruvate hydrolase